MATPSLFSVEGHTAVVTGGTRGIGQAVAIALAEAGADLILVQVRPPPSHLPVQARTQTNMETLTTKENSATNPQQPPVTPSSPSTAKPPSTPPT